MENVKVMLVEDFEGWAEVHQTEKRERLILDKGNSTFKGRAVRSCLIVVYQCVSLCIEIPIYISRNSVKVILVFRKTFITSIVCYLKGKVILLIKSLLVVKDSMVGDLKVTAYFSAPETEDHILREQIPMFYK